MVGDPFEVAQIAQKLLKRTVVECSSGSITFLERGQLLVSIRSEKFGFSVARPQHLLALRDPLRLKSIFQILKDIK